MALNTLRDERLAIGGQVFDNGAKAFWAIIDRNGAVQQYREMPDYANVLKTIDLGEGRFLIAGDSQKQPGLFFEIDEFE